MMAKDPASRVQTAGEVAQMLAPFCRSSGAPESEGSRGHPAWHEKQQPERADESSPERHTRPAGSRSPGKKARILAMLATGVMIGLCLIVLAIPSGRRRSRHVRYE